MWTKKFNWPTWHRRTALTIGLLLLLQIITGLALSFQGQWDQLFFSSAEGASEYSWEQIHQDVSHQLAEYQLTRWYPAPETGAAHRLVFTSDSRFWPQLAYVDAGSGALLGAGPLWHYPQHLAAYVHAHLLIGSAGEYLVTALGVAVGFLALSGLTMWWPASRKQLVERLRVHWHKPPVVRYFQAHRSVGALLSLGFLLLATTGALIAGKWLYLPAEDIPAAPASVAANSRPPLDAIMRQVTRLYPQATVRRLLFDTAEHRWVDLEIVERGAQHLSAVTHLRFDNTGGIVNTLPYADRAAVHRFYTWLVPIHSGRLIGLGGQLLNALLGVGLLIVGVLGVLRWVHRRSALRQRARQTQG